MSKEVVQADTASKEEWPVEQSEKLIRAQQLLEEADRDIAQRTKLQTATDKELEVLQRENAELKKAVSDNDDFMAFMRGELDDFECCCGKTHEATPPMMWPELIACIVRKSNESLQARLDKAEAALRILLSSHGCWSNDEPEIREEVSGQFDITLDEADLVIVAASKEPVGEADKSI